MMCSQQYPCVFQGSNLRTAVGTGPTVGMVLRLVTNEVCRALKCFMITYVLLEEIADSELPLALLF